MIADKPRAATLVAALKSALDAHDQSAVDLFTQCIDSEQAYRFYTTDNDEAIDSGKALLAALIQERTARSDDRLDRIEAQLNALRQSFDRSHHGPLYTR
jgi:hypothetical protein